MNIYIHLENITRELDSKLLLGTLAASRGHDVIISDTESIEKGMRRGVLAPGIFHTKSLTPAPQKIARHDALVKSGNLITSIDEENRISHHGFDNFAKKRFSEQTIKNSAAVFGWGPDDHETLKKIYPNQSSKFYKTGSPRVDLWRPLLSDYWSYPKGAPNKPFLLVISNMTYANYAVPFKNLIWRERENGHYEREPGLLINNFLIAAEHYRITASFMDAIIHLANNNKGYEIVLRPHQNEDMQSWKIYLKGVPNVHVVREGSITNWVKNAFAIMHNGCTTALEATISDKPLLTYVPFKQDYGNELSNDLGYLIKSKEELEIKVNSIFNDPKTNIKKFSEIDLPKLVSNKIYIDDNELASEKMIKIWENLAQNNDVLSKSSKWKSFELLLKLMKVNGIIGKVFKSISTGNLNTGKKNFKFPPLEYNYINTRVKKIQNTMGLSKNIKCKLLSDRTILIKKYK